jgi:oligoribonuclease (3'-5' exoribonuclease)
VAGDHRPVAGDSVSSERRFAIRAMKIVGEAKKLFMFY